METREEKLATWADSTDARLRSLRILTGSLDLDAQGICKDMCVTETSIDIEHIKDQLLATANNIGDSKSNLWHFKAVSFPRLRPGRLTLSFPKQVFLQIQDSWNLHPRTIEVFLSNNGVCTTFDSTNSNRTWLLMKVPNSRSTGFDCVSVTCDAILRTTYALYHHLEDEASVFATLHSTPERFIDPFSFVAALYRSHHQHIETHRNTIDDAVRDVERQTGFGNPGRLMMSADGRRPSLDEYPLLTDPKRTIQQLSYCQTDIAIIGHVARCCVECGDWLVQAIDDSIGPEGSTHNVQDQRLPDSLRSIRPAIRQDIEYTRRRTAMLLSQVQAIRDRAQSQTSFVSPLPHHHPYLHPHV